MRLTPTVMPLLDQLWSSSLMHVGTGDCSERAVAPCRHQMPGDFAFVLVGGALRGFRERHVSLRHVPEP